MSLATFKRKSITKFNGTNKSGKPPGGYWLPQGPFGQSTEVLRQAIQNFGPVGFSINGPHRNVGRVGQEMKMSKNGTPFRGQHPIGWGGTNGRYPYSEPVFNSNRVITQGQQWLYVKQSTLSTKGMLEKKYRWINNGQYPNYWVQPNYAHSNQSQTASQGMYVHTKTTQNMCVTDVNASDKYVGSIKGCGPTLCSTGTSTARFKYNDMARNGPYGKQLHIPETSSMHTLRIQRRCANPLGPQKPFPYATNGDTCNTLDVTYTVPPEWYITPTSHEETEQEFLAARALLAEKVGPLIIGQAQFGNTIQTLSGGDAA